MPATKTKKTAAKTTKSANASAKSDQRTGFAPRSQLDLEETKKLEAARARKAKAKPDGGGQTKTTKLSALDAAAQVLAASGEPMTCQALIEAMAGKGLWSSPNGKTPERTLYSALAREINEKGADARFVKVERGKFAAKK
jgi:hypothetical protein